MAKPNLMRNGANASLARTPLIKTGRSVFPIGFSRKQTMLASYLTPIFFQETCPGDTWNVSLTQFIRLATQVTAPMDNLWVDFYFFYFPYRLYWDNFKKQHGERIDPDDHIDYITPTITSENGFTARSIYDYMGGIRMGQKGTKITALPFRAYNDIWNTYFRASTIQDSLTVKRDDSDDNESDYELIKVNKMHDYFTDMLPTLMAGGEGVNIPLGSEAPVIGTGDALGLTANPAANTAQALLMQNSVHSITGTQATGYVADYKRYLTMDTTQLINDAMELPPTADLSGTAQGPTAALGVTTNKALSGLKADLSNAVAASIQAMRLAIDTAELLERDNRNGCRYHDIIYGRYKTIVPDLMLYHPQLVGSMKVPLFTTPVVQTSGTGTTGQNTPQGNIAGYGVTASKNKVITVSTPEFGGIMGLACIRAVPQYQQGLHKRWTRFERYDYYYPEFMALSDQAVKKSEIYLQDNDILNSDTNEPENDDILGYIGRYDEYRYFNNQICGEFRSDYVRTMDSWHYAEKFENAPELNSKFIEDDTVDILQRSLAVQTELDGTPAEQFLCDFQFTGSVVRGMPTKAIPRTGGNILV